MLNLLSSSSLLLLIHHSSLITHLTGLPPVFVSSPAKHGDTFLSYSSKTPDSSIPYVFPAFSPSGTASAQNRFSVPSVEWKYLYPSIVNCLSWKLPSSIFAFFSLASLSLGLTTWTTSVPLAMALISFSTFIGGGFQMRALKVGSYAFPREQSALMSGIASGSWSLVNFVLLNAISAGVAIGGLRLMPSLEPDPPFRAAKSRPGRGT